MFLSEKKPLYSSILTKTILEIYSRCYSELVRYVRRVIDNREKNQLTWLGKKNWCDDFHCVPTKQKVRKYAGK